MIAAVSTQERPCASFSITQRNAAVHVVLVDAEDLPRVAAAGPWHVKRGHGRWYVRRNVYDDDGRKTTQGLHRFLMGDPDGMQVDHVNGDSLDNRRCNIRVATPSQNECNKGVRRDSASGLKGVHFNRSAGTWRAEVKLNGKRLYLGRFAAPELAYAAYCAAAAELHGEFARVK